MINSIFKITENGLDCMFTDKYWEMSRYQQSILLILYTCFLSDQHSFGLESIENIMNRKGLLSISVQEFKNLCNELKDNKEACDDFLNLEFN
jgi:hypothetical protein